MLKKYLPISLILILSLGLYSGCDTLLPEGSPSAIPDATPVVVLPSDSPHATPNTSPSPALPPSPSPGKQPAEDPEYLEDPSELSMNSTDWASSVLMPYVDDDPVTEKAVEKQATANKIVTPRGYTIYLIDGYQYRELVGGIKISSGGTNAWPVLSLNLEIQSFKKGTDIKEKILEWMKENNTEFSSEETLDNSEISYIAHGKELPGNTGIQTAAYIVGKANPPDGQTVVAFTVFVADYPGLLKNLEWMMKTFRLN